MRGSSARLAGTSVRLADLTFPATRFLLARTRAAFVHLDNLVSFAKRDRDGRVDGYLQGWLPDEVVLLFFRQGELVNAAELAPARRGIVPVGEALRRLRAEPERGELAYAEAPLEQLEWMYAACQGAMTPRFEGERDPARMFPVLAREGFSGVLEMIASGAVCYLRFEQGQFAAAATPERGGRSLPQFLESLFSLREDGSPATIVTHEVPSPGPLPTQALPSQIRMLREVYTRLVRAAEEEMPGEGTRKAERLHGTVVRDYPALTTLGPGDRTEGGAVAGERLTAALAAWTSELLREAEVMVPGSAPRILGTAARDHRHALQAAGYFDQVPWTPRW